MKQNEQSSCEIRSRIGGQALIEGVMMRGLDNAVMAVRKPDGGITVEEQKLSRSKFMRVISKIWILRGIFVFISSMITGYRCMSRSAELASDGTEEESEPSRFEKWLDKTFGENLTKAVTILGTVLGVVLAVFLFMLLPTAAVKGLDHLVPLFGWKPWLEGIIKMAIFIGYLALISHMKEMKRVFEYHGAEHKSIFCYEKGLELNVENVKAQRRFHPRCGTSFLVLILIISILIYSVVPWNTIMGRVALKIVMLPLVMGIGYELLKLCGRYDNFLTKIVAWPGLMIQRITTSEPDESQIEVAIAALQPVIPENRADDKW